MLDEGLSQDSWAPLGAGAFWVAVIAMLCMLVIDRLRLDLFYSLRFTVYIGGGIVATAGARLWWLGRQVC